MLHGIWALLERSLRIDARALGPHRVRFGLMVAISIALHFALLDSLRLGAPGLRFFNTTVVLNVIFMTLLGVSYFSSTITEEKDEEALGLMLMTGISPLVILLGKSGGRLIQSLLLVAVQYPFTLLAVTMGGVTTTQIQAVYFALLAYLGLLAGIGLFCSTLARNSQMAAVWTTVLLLVYFVIPVCCRSYLINAGPGIRMLDLVLHWIGDSCLFLQLPYFFASGFEASPISRQVISNLLMGVIFFCMSWLAMIHIAANPTTDASVASQRSYNFRFRGILCPGRATSNPFFWKDFHFVAGGWLGIVCRFTLYVSIYLAIVIFYSLWLGRNGNWAAVGRGSSQVYIFLMMFLIAFDVSLLVVHGLREEVRERTLGSLLILPHSIQSILSFKLLGLLLVWMPGPLCLVCAMNFLPDGAELAKKIFANSGLSFVCFAHGLLIPHVAGVAAMYMRWGSVPVAICLVITAYSLTIVGFLSLATNNGPDSPFLFFVGFALLFGCATCHGVIARRAEALAATS